MFEVPADLDAEHRAVLAALPVPMASAGVRCLLALGAKDHTYAQAHRRTALAQPRSAGIRAGRLRRHAALAEARSRELVAEVR